jgi:hypothetical protein
MQEKAKTRRQQNDALGQTKNKTSFLSFNSPIAKKAEQLYYSG